MGKLAHLSKALKAYKASGPIYTPIEAAQFLRQRQEKIAYWDKVRGLGPNMPDEEYPDESIPGEAYNALPERAQGIDLAL